MNAAHFRAPEKACVMYLILIQSPLLGTPPRTQVLPRSSSTCGSLRMEGLGGRLRFCPLYLGPLERRGYLQILPTFGSKATIGSTYKG